MSQRPSQIKERHLHRRAIAYGRQSTEQQVRENVGSTALQLDLPLRLRDWGWPDERIDQMDDFGVTGSNPGGRASFNSLLARMKAEEVGLVAVTQDSRLARNLLDFAAFADVARRFDVLLAYGEQVIDFQDPNGEFVATILGSNATRENRVRTELSRQARRKKAEAGWAPTGPPVGYVRRPGGAWVKDPDPQVCEAIQLLFDKFFEVGTARGLVRYLRQHHIQLPRKPRRGQGAWVDATQSNILRLLQHPAYAGVYVYGRTTVDERRDRYATGKHRFRRLPPGEWARKPDHHEGYVLQTRWAEIQQRLAANRITRIAPAGRGPALAQGLLRCAVHGMAFVTTYSGRRIEPDGRVIRLAQYSCRWERHACSSAQHTSIMAHHLDPVVETEVLETLASPSLELLTQAAREALREHDVLERGRHDEVRRLQAAASTAERALEQTELDQVHLRRRLAVRAEAALQQLHDRETFFQLHPLTPPLMLTDSEFSELESLVADLPRLWRHPNVSAEQRKAILRTVIQAVEATPGPNSWDLEIVWATGVRTHHSLATCRGRREQLAPAISLIRSRFQEGATAPQITRELNDAGMCQEFGAWNLRRVRNVIARHQREAIDGLARLPRRRSASPYILGLRARGLRPAEIVAQAREDGVVTLLHRPVTFAAVCAALRRERNRQANGAATPLAGLAGPFGGPACPNTSDSPGSSEHA
jgi:DNA invertase Pin-like site-specific DNA recombinase